MYKRLYFIGIPAYIVMLVFSLVFYKERTILLDSAYNLFYIIKDNNFCIQHYRFGDVLSQLLPLATVRTGQPLPVVLAAYSAGFVLCYFLAYFICGSVLKRYDMAIVILLLNILFVSDTFYFMQSQLPEAIALLMILFSILEGKQLNTTSLLSWCVLALLVITVVFFHPIAVFVIFFCSLFFILSKQLLIDKRLLYATGALYLVTMLVKMTVFKTPYENHSMSGMKNFISQFPDYFTIYSNKRFFYDCVTKYYWIAVLFIGTTVYYTMRKEYKKLGVFLLFFIGYLALVNISYPFASTPEFYMENLYLPLAVFIGIPFVFDMLPMLDKKKIALPVLLLILITGSIRLYATHTTYTARLDYERRILSEYDNKKVILQAKKTDTDTLQMLWGTPYEFLLLSTCEQNKPASIIIDENAGKFGWADDLRNALVVNWNLFMYKDINPKYFHFTDTVTGYKVVR